MRIRIKRSVSVYSEYQKPFLELLLKACEGARAAVGVDARPYIEVAKGGTTFNVKVFSDFDSLAQYEDKFLHQLLKNDSFLDGAESAAEMIVDNPRDELFVRLDPNDYFMNRKGRVELTDPGEDVAEAPKKFLLERMFNAQAGKLRQTMAMNFKLMEEFAQNNLIMPKYYCTRFAADRIGGSAAYFEFNNVAEIESDLIDYENKVDAALLIRPIADTYFRLIDAELIEGVETKDSVETEESPRVLVSDL